jgi:PKD repeat protein
MKRTLFTCLLLTILFSFSIFILPAQSPFCGADIFLKELEKNLVQKQIFENYQDDLRMYQQWMQQKGDQKKLTEGDFTGDELIIPVVVHVVHPAGQSPGVGTNISYTQIQAQIDALNAAFGKQYPIYNGQDHGPYAVETGLQFCLARNAPDCTNWSDPGEPGVMRYGATGGEDVTGTALSAASQLVGFTHGSCPFSFDHYLNIWVVSSIDGGAVAGYGTFTQNWLPLEGVVMAAPFFGDNTVSGNTFPLDASLDQGKILAHEVGHYLDLFHTFQGGCAGAGNPGTSSPCDMEGDLVCDTPPSTLSSYTPCSSAGTNTCSDQLAAFGNTDAPDMFENYMSYSDDNCMNTFTEGQRQRMLASLKMARSSLVSSENLVRTGLISPQGCLGPQLLANIYRTSPVCLDDLAYLTTDEAPANLATSWDWSITPSSFTFENGTSSTSAAPVLSFQEPGLYTLILEASAGSETVSDTTKLIVDPCGPLDQQKLDQANWYFGYNAALSFVSGAPVSVSPAPLSSSEACAAVSDEQGNFLFSTNGVRIWNQNHQIMPGVVSSPMAGSPNSAFFSPSSTQGAMILQDPGNPERYYVFSGPDSPNPQNPQQYFQGLYYSIVDMSLQNGLGDVVMLNQAADPFIYAAEPLTAIPHCNGRDYWVLCKGIQEGYNDQIMAYLLTPQGLEPAVFSDGYTLPVPADQQQPWDYIGNFEASPDGQLLAAFKRSSPQRLYVYAFDNVTGKLSLLSESSVPFWGGMMSFSPSGRYLYSLGGATLQKKLVQVDLLDPANPVFNEVDSPHPNAYAALQIGPDNKVYIARQYSDVIAVINFPDEPVDQAGFVYDGVNLLSGQDCYIGMPNMIDALPVDEIPADFSIDFPTCLEVAVEIDPCWSVFDASWDFGDDSPLASGDVVTHVYPGPGEYTIELTLSSALGVQAVIQKTVEVSLEIPPIYGPQAVCADTPVPPDYSTDPVDGASYNWTFLQGNGQITGNPNGQNVGVDWGGESGILQLEVITGSGCVLTNTVSVDVFVSPVVDLPFEFLVYEDDPVALNGTISGGAPPYELEWQPDASLSFPNFPVLLPALAAPDENTSYTLTATDMNGCQHVDAITVLVEGSNSIGEPVPDISLQVFPNPSTGRVWIQGDGWTGKDASIRIYDIRGRLFEQQTLKPGDQTEVYLSQKGVFVYEVWLKGRSVDRGKLVIIR